MRNKKWIRESLCMNIISRKILTSCFVSLEVFKRSKPFYSSYDSPPANSGVRALHFLYTSPSGQHWDVKSYPCVLPSTQAAVIIVFCMCHLVQCSSHCKTSNNKMGSRVVRTVQDATEMAEFVRMLFCTSGRATTGSSAGNRLDGV